MYFWNIEKLKEDIVAGRFSEKDHFIYLLMFVALAAILTEAALNMGTRATIPNIWDAVNSIGHILIPVMGTFFAYEANGAREGKDFLGRYLSIGFVMTIRFLALLVPIITAPIFYYMYAFRGESAVLMIVTTPLEVIVFLAWLVFLYVRICKHIGDVKSS